MVEVLVMDEETKEEFWKLPLVHFAATIGVELTPAHSILMGGWIRRHNARILDRCIELAEKEAQALRHAISLN